MLACMDVDYREAEAVAACLVFGDWTDARERERIVERVSPVEPYVPGQFYRRELPCLMRVLARVRDPLDAVVVDGYVWLDGADHPGLGAHLYEALERRVPVIGVAKTPFKGSDFAVCALRGSSAKPLYVTAAGIDPGAAAARVRGMHGPNRIPTLLREVDRLCRAA